MRGDIRKIIWHCLERGGYDTETEDGRQRAIADFVNLSSATTEENRQNIIRLMRGEDISEPLWTITGAITVAIEGVAGVRFEAQRLRQIETSHIEYNGGCNGDDCAVDTKV